MHAGYLQKMKLWVIHPLIAMNNSKQPQAEVAYELLPLLRVYNDGTVQRLIGTDTVPASTDPTTGVTSKDITIDPHSQHTSPPLPPQHTPNPEVPSCRLLPRWWLLCLIPIHFAVPQLPQRPRGSSQVIAVSVNYRKAPEHALPTAYEDSWAALQWIVSHCGHGGPEAWLNEHVDFQRVFLAGDSAGANIVHNLALVAGHPEFGLTVQLLGIALIHPYFWGSIPIGSEALQPEKKAFLDRLWQLLLPSSTADTDDPRINPVAEGAPSLVGLGCRRVLICVAERDVTKDRAWAYYEALSRSGWIGVVEMNETEGVDHVFHLYDLEAPNSKDLIKDLAAFFNRDVPPLI